MYRTPSFHFSVGLSKSIQGLVSLVENYPRNYCSPFPWYFIPLLHGTYWWYLCRESDWECNPITVHYLCVNSKSRLSLLYCILYLSTSSTVYQVVVLISMNIEIKKVHSPSPFVLSWESVHYIKTHYNMDFFMQIAFRQWDVGDVDLKIARFKRFRAMHRHEI